MSEVTVKIDLSKFRSRFDSAVDAGLKAAAGLLTEAARESMGRGHGGLPSAPGQPPNVQRNTLRQSVTFVKAKPGLYYVGTGLALGRWMEKGVRNTNPSHKWIVVPISKEAKSKSARLGAKAAISQLKANPNFAEFKAKQGFLLGLNKGRGKKKTFEAWYYVTNRSFTILPRPWLGPAALLNRGAMLSIFKEQATKKLQSFSTVEAVVL